ncbi:S8 family serine peptidase [Streptomyces sp. NPDC046915]|uniref:S8 family peptidase n=1 Tax=Streptomyces sp. NPDC046915 TaxID=3155257 RepID=UPI003404A03F
MDTAKTAARSPGLVWSLRGRRPQDIGVTADGERPGHAWDWRDARGEGVRVCVVDSGVEGGHPLIGRVDGAWAVTKGEHGIRVLETEATDSCGHGTACAGIIRRTAPECELYSVQVLGRTFGGTGDVLLAGLRWAIREGFDVINLSLSTTRVRFVEELRSLADEAYFRGTVIVASAHNTPVESFPWRFASVISVGSHAEDEPELHLYNPQPPVEFFAPGQNVQVAWLDGKTIRTTGNSYATPYISGLCARILSRHRRLTSFQLKTALYLSAANVHIGMRGAP